MTNPVYTFLIMGCLIDLVVGMVFVLGLHKLFPKVSVNRLAYLAAGMFSISSAIYGNPSSFLTFLLMTIIGTAIWGTIYVGLWRLISYVFKKRVSVQNSAQSPEQQLTMANQGESEFITCPSCGFRQSSGNIYCRSCGKRLGEAKAA